MSTLRKTADRQGVKQPSRQLMEPECTDKFLSPPARPIPPTPGSDLQGVAGPLELRPRKSGSWDPNWGACGGRQQKLQVAAINPL